MQFDFLRRLFGGGAAKTPGPAKASLEKPSVPVAVKAQPPVALENEVPEPAPLAEPVDRAKLRSELVAEQQAMLAESRALLIGAGAADLARRVQICWNGRMRSTAGMAYPGKALVTLNPRLREFGAEEVSRTLRHELAHLLAHERAGRKRISAHGPEWRRACRDLGLPNEKRTHNLPLPRRAMERKHRYRCPGCGAEIARVKPLKRDSACLKCCQKHSRGRYDARFRFVKVRA